MLFALRNVYLEHKKIWEQNENCGSYPCRPMTKDLIYDIIREVRGAGGVVKSLVSDMAQACNSIEIFVPEHGPSDEWRFLDMSKLKVL